MAEGFGGKIKEFFGYGGVDAYTDPYYQDEFDEREREARHSRDEDYRDYDRREDHAEARIEGHRYADPYDSLPADTHQDRIGRARPYLGSASPIPVKKEPHIVHLAVTEFRHSSQIVRDFLRGDIVVFSLAGADTEEAKRILDFCLGLSKGAEGELDKLDGVRNFILIPKGISLTPSQRAQILDRK